MIYWKQCIWKHKNESRDINFLVKKDVVGKGSWKTEFGKFDRKLLRMKLES